MANLKTRISLKYDTLANWQKSTLKLNKGELAIAVIPTADPENKQLPPVMFKVGDGEHTFAQLGDNWASALAADVYSWAKAANRPAYKYGDNDLTGFGTAAAKNVGDFDAAGAAATAEANAKAYVDEQIGAIPPQAEYTLETGATDGSLVLKKDGVAVGDPAVVKGWAELLTSIGEKYTKPEGGIPKSDLATAVQTSLGKADSSIQSVSLAGGTNNGTLKLTVDGTATDNIAVTGLGSAAYTAADAYDTAGKAQELVGAHNVSAEAHSDIRQSVTALAEKVSGRATSYVYKNKSDAAYTTAIGKAGSFVVGDTIYFTDTDILDEWVTKVNAAAPYYEFQEIETEKPSFDGYVKGTGLTADKLVLGNTGSNVKASIYGVSGTLTAADNANLPTSKAVADYVGGQLDNLDATKVSATAAQTISSIEQVNGKITIGAAQNIQIAQSQVTGLGTALGGKQDKIDTAHPLSADLVSGLGAAAKKGVDTAVSATSENLPTSKAVASYVGGEIGKIVIPTVNNAALKDASDAIIFTANASADVKITVIDCGNATGWEA